MIDVWSGCVDEFEKCYYEAGAVDDKAERRRLLDPSRISFRKERAERFDVRPTTS